jgi:hypothetical protein
MNFRFRAVSTAAFAFCLSATVFANPDTPTAANYAKLPMSFEPNQGQADSQFRFLARGSGYTLLLSPTEADLGLRSASAGSSTRAKDPGDPSATNGVNTPDPLAILRLRFLGGNAAAQIEGLDEQPGVSNYYIGNDPAKWRTNVPHFSRVRYKNLYPGIDIVYYGNQGRLEYDFIVSPGANPSAIALAFDGAGKMKINLAGDLVISTSGGEVYLHKPAIYQEVAGKRHPVSGGFVADATRKVGFHVAKYDTGRPLIIDPVLVYSTYLGGTGDDKALAIAVDNAGNAYVTGYTISLNFPTINAARNFCGDNGICDLYTDPTLQFGPVSDAFVAKIDTTKSGANSLIYSTFLGGGPEFILLNNANIAIGSGADQGNAIAVDASGNAYVTGNTGSFDFPIIGAIPRPGVACTGSGTFFPLPCFVSDAFVSKFDPSGALVYSTPLGGRVGPLCGSSHACSDFAGNILTSGFGIGEDSANGIAVDNAGNAYVIGSTDSIDFVTTAGGFQTVLSAASGNGAAFLVKIDTTKSGIDSLVYSSYFGATNNFSTHIGTAITLDSANNVYVAGTLRVGLDSVPTTNGVLQTAADSGFVAKFDLTQSGSASLLYSTYFPLGPAREPGFIEPGLSGIAVDKADNVYVTGIYDNALSFPLTTGAYDSCAAVGPSDCGMGIFLSKLNATGSALIYSARLGGDVFDEDFIPQPGGIAVDSNGNAYITGAADYGDIAGVNGGPNVAAPFPGSPLVGNCEASGTHCFGAAYVTMLNPQGTAIVYSNLLSGGDTDCTVGVNTYGHGVAVDSAGNAYFAGGACSSSRFPSNFPTTPNAFQPSIGSLNPAFDAYVLKLGPVCATDISSSVSVTRSGYSYNPLSRRYAQTVTLKNNSGSPIAGPISLALDGLTANATLFNPAGTTACAVPLGSPYVTVAGPLAPGSSASVVLQFTDPMKTGFNYSTRVLAGAQP